ncbi:hypothetical protein R1sor_020529 [Riccia sorocarpa]|uniref:Thiol-disulfide oxidoreductase DCC n=1 Tax=Riccia sorocarpa TaxID=122646 RepID=A0ABD3IK51_9MARC
MARAVASGLQLIQPIPKPALAFTKSLANLHVPPFPAAVVLGARENDFSRIKNYSAINNGVVPCRVSAVRTSAVVGAGTSNSGLSSEMKTLKAKGDSYFLVDKRPIILFDGICNMCNGGVNFMLDNDPEGKVRFAALQSEAGRALLVRSGRAPDDLSSILLVDEERAYIKSEAILGMAKYLQSPFPPLGLAASLVPLFMRDVLYDQIAANRYSIMGQTSSCRTCVHIWTVFGMVLISGQTVGV